MYRFIEKLQDGRASSFILFAGFIILLQLTACKDSGSVGSAIGNSGSKLTVDTVQVTGLQTDTLNSYAGNRPYFSIGRFQDPLFGQVSVTALIKPSLPSYNEDMPINENTRMQLKLAIHEESVYGDTLASARFNIVEIGELWRAPAWRLKDDIRLVPGSKVASFTITDDDTLKVSLSSDWVQKYGTYYNNTDSTRRDKYLQDFYGLAIVPQNAGKIVSVDPTTSNFVAINESSSDSTEGDSLKINLGGWANSLDRSNTLLTDSTTTKVYNTLEQVLTFNYDLSSGNVNALNIAKAELLVYRDDLQLTESLNQDPHVVRPAPGPLRLYYVDGEELPQSIDPGNSLTGNGGIYDKDDDAYHFNITSLVRGGFFDAADSSNTFYIKLGNDDGVIRSSIVFNGQAGDEKTPKLIITSTNNR